VLNGLRFRRRFRVYRGRDPAPNGSRLSPPVGLSESPTLRTNCARICTEALAFGESLLRVVQPAELEQRIGATEIGVGEARSLP
jgi:hypothetical protein